MQPQRALLLVISMLLLLATEASTIAEPRRPYVEPPELERLRRQGNERFRAGDFVGAARVYDRGIEEARRRGERRSAIRFLNNAGSADYRLRRYRDAARRYLEARSLAEQERDAEIAAVASFNLSSLYLQSGEVDTAREAAARGLAAAPAGGRFRANLLMQLALLELRKPDCPAAERLLREAVSDARGKADLPAEAQAWNELGSALLQCGQADAAERPLLEAYRLRMLTRDPQLHFTYESLAHLRLERNDPANALTLLDRAAETGSADSWPMLAARGRADAALGRAQAAYSDLRAALARVRDWRGEMMPGDAFRVRSEVEARRVYSAFIAAAAARYRETRRRIYAEEALDAAEDGRAASLRALWAASDRPRTLPPEYWRAVDELQRAEAGAINGETGGVALERLRARLAEMDAEAGLDLPAEDIGSGARLIPALRGALAADEVYIGFHTADEATWIWAVTRDGLEMSAGPAAPELTGRVARFVDMLRAGSAEADELGRALYADLFEKLPPRLLSRSRWTVAPDGPLFDLPMAALPLNGGRRLVEEHGLRMTTGVHALLRPARLPAAGPLIAAGDAVYNRADPRCPADARRGAAGRPELPRLLGSGREVETCAGIWRAGGRQVRLLKGVAVKKAQLTQAVAGGAAVVHIAAHMLFPPGGNGRGMLALSMQDNGQPELWSDTEVAGMTARVGLVVLDGCSSGRGPVLPGAGLMGMTRAWLAAGARAVIATRWPVPDQDEGAIFASLYRRYLEERSEPDAASFGALLREAQLSEIRAGGRRAAPARWAAYFSVERN